MPVQRFGWRRGRWGAMSRMKGVTRIQQHRMPRPTLNLSLSIPKTPPPLVTNDPGLPVAGERQSPRSSSTRQASAEQRFPGMPTALPPRAAGQRPRLAGLSLPGIGTGSQAFAPTAAPPMDNRQRLKEDAAEIARYLKTASPRIIQGDGQPPTLADMGKPAVQTQHFSTSNFGNDFFVNVAHRGDTGKSTFDGHKVHLSVDKAQFGQAYAALAPLLFSGESPIRRFKLTDMERAGAGPQNPHSDRVTQGAQFTLYLQSHPQTGHYDAQHLHALQSFIGQCEGALTDAGVSSGSMPASDAPLGSHASYRSEDYDRDASQVAQMAHDPMCTLLKTRKDESA